MRVVRIQARIRALCRHVMPGFRLGYVIGPEDIHLKLVQTKQGY